MSRCPMDSSGSGNEQGLSFLRNENLSAVMNTVLDGLIIIDAHGLIQSFNPSASRVFGYTVEEVLGKNVNMLMPEPYAEEHDGYLKNYIETHNPKVIGIGREVYGKRKNGEVFPMDLGVNQMCIGGKVMFVGTVRDISERKAHEQEIRKYIYSLKVSNQELDDFAYIASHDLKEPLRGLSNNANFLKEDYGDVLEKNALSRLDRIVFLCERMEALVNDLLYFSRLGKKELAIKKVAVADLIHDIKSMMEADSHDGVVEIKIKGDFPKITCDALRLTEVFRNLISNSIKYNKSAIKEVEIGYLDQVQGQESGKHVFYVKDNGIGIPEAYHKDIFRIFKRLHDEEDKFRGTGVGLTFVKKIVERHGGSIWLESEMEKGTTFYFSLEKGIEDEQALSIAN